MAKEIDGDGNCLYNAVSTAYTGGYKLQRALRVGSMRKCMDTCVLVVVFAGVLWRASVTVPVSARACA